VPKQSAKMSKKGKERLLRSARNDMKKDFLDSIRQWERLKE
jgi:hypothetical protein